MERRNFQSDASKKLDLWSTELSRIQSRVQAGEAPDLADLYERLALAKAKEETAHQQLAQLDLGAEDTTWEALKRALEATLADLERALRFAARIFTDH